MKKFDNIRQLWDYCLYCPICRSPSRTITVTVGPDDTFTLSEFEKKDSELKLTCGFRHRANIRRNQSPVYTSIYVIDCENNTFTIHVSGEDQKVIDRGKKSYFFCYIYSKCNGCKNTNLNSSDLEFDLENKTISNIQLDDETAYLVFEKDHFHIKLSHIRNVTMVSRCETMGDARIDDPKIIELPLVNLDFSNAPKVINKIKTLILFS